MRAAARHESRPGGGWTSAITRGVGTDPVGGESQVGPGLRVRRHPSPLGDPWSSDRAIDRGLRPRGSLPQWRGFRRHRRTSGSSRNPEVEGWAATTPDPVRHARHSRSPFTSDHTPRRAGAKGLPGRRIASSARGHLRWSGARGGLGEAGRRPVQGAGRGSPRRKRAARRCEGPRSRSGHRLRLTVPHLAQRGRPRAARVADEGSSRGRPCPFLSGADLAVRHGTLDAPRGTPIAVWGPGGTGLLTPRPADPARTSLAGSRAESRRCRRAATGHSCGDDEVDVLRTKEGAGAPGRAMPHREAP